MSFDSILSGTLNVWLAPILPSQRVFVLYLASAFVLAIGTYVYFSYREENARPGGVSKGLVGFIFDKEVWLHRSAVQDYAYFALNAIVYYGVAVQLMLSGHLFYGLFTGGLETLFGVRQEPLFVPSAVSAALYTLAVVLAIDLAVWLTHYLQHKVELLWQFHKVHHSAEVLTPMTVYRMHPVDLLFTGSVSAILVGGSLAGFVYVTKSQPNEFAVMNVNIITFAFYLIGYNLRHSHIWLSYPRWLSYILISPAQHQIHHSVERKHWDRNMGLIFAFWDWVFGTLYVPKGYEKLTYGVAGDDPNPFKNVLEIYWKPFQMAWGTIRKAEPKRVVLLTVIGVGTAGAVLMQPGFSADRDLPSRHLEELTWTEVHAALEDGFTTVIIPTGGTEQNGPHVVLGKHNYVIRATSERIATELGGTLIAPVLAYVPEGQTGEAPSGHMRWPGTLSLPEPVFEAVLEHSVRSMATHGFTRILLIGDSLGNQQPQANVADRLNAEWQGKGIKVLHVGSYYDANGQFDHLLNEGFSAGEIGGHAGIRDTSEMIAVAPEGVRQKFLPAQKGMEEGSDGAPGLATKEIGDKMIDLKVRAALQQINTESATN